MITCCFAFAPVAANNCQGDFETFKESILIIKSTQCLPFQAMNSFPELFTVFHCSNLSFPQSLEGHTRLETSSEKMIQFTLAKDTKRIDKKRTGRAFYGPHP